MKSKTCDSQNQFSIRWKVKPMRSLTLELRYADKPPYMDYADNPPSIVIDVEVTLSAAGEQR